MKLVVGILNVLERGNLEWIRYHCPKTAVINEPNSTLPGFIEVLRYLLNPFHCIWPILSLLQRSLFLERLYSVTGK